MVVVMDNAISGTNQPNIIKHLYKHHLSTDGNQSIETMLTIAINTHIDNTTAARTHQTMYVCNTYMHVIRMYVCNMYVYVIRMHV